MKLNSDQQRAVDINSNAVVSAGAGSGKTSVLSRRYIRLVVDDRIPVRRILALTFTRKAAAEMYQRIYTALAAHSDDPFVAEQLAHFEEAFISTVDSFCGTVARDGCSTYGVAPGFRIDEDQLRQQTTLLALQFLRARLSDPGLSSVVELNGFQKTWDALAELGKEHVSVSSPGNFPDMLARQRDAILHRMKELEYRIENDLRAILDLDPQTAKCVAAAQPIADSILDSDPFLSRGTVSRLDQTVAEAAAQAVERVASISLRCGSSKKDDVLLLKECVTRLRDDAPLYASAVRTLSTVPRQESLYRLLDEFSEQVRSTKQQNGLLSYHDVLELAIATLQSDEELRSYYKRRYDAIMIDEFQDNNEEQKRLLYLLAERRDSFVQPVPEAADLEPEKLFFVGDEKQSIYRFRGADVSVFRTLADDFGEGAAISLGCNYRSEPGLIRFFNSLFASVFADASLPYEARFSPLAFRDATPGLTPSVHLCRLTRRDRGDDTHLSDVDAQAYHIASTIRGIVGEGALAIGGDGRTAQYGDIAILLKSSSNQIRLERMLRLFGIPYVSQSVRSLFLEAPANDIYQALQLALYPQDRVAYAGFLRSPLVNLSDEAIVRLLLHDPDEGLFPEIADLFPEDQVRLGIARSRWELLRQRSGGPITDLLRMIWFEWGYRYHLLRRDDYAVYLEYYELLWDLAHSFAERGLAAFLDEVRGQLGQNAKLDELDSLRDSAPGVQIMTIHKSKGLEFPVVFVANTENTGRNDNVSDAAYHWLPDLGPAFNIGYVPDGTVKEQAANFLYSIQADQNALEEDAERKRLLYVAATRAESHLLFFGSDKDNTGSLNELILPAFAAAEDALDSVSGLEIRRHEFDPVETGADLRARLQPGHRTIGSLATHYQSLAVIERHATRSEFAVTELNASFTLFSGLNQPVGRSSDSSSDGSAQLDIDPLLEKHNLHAPFGTLAHVCIERAPDGGYDNPPSLDQIPDDPQVDATLARVLSNAEQTQVRQWAAELANRFLQSEFWTGRPRGLSVEHEVPFLLRPIADHSLLVRGKIDLILSDSESVQVVDFKSDRLVDPHHYSLQLEMYRRAATALFALPVSVALFDLRRASLVPIAPADTHLIDSFLRGPEIELTEQW
jgi:ATP-dependent exoDNAse (exonuclease V) beta subunit